MLLRWSQCGSLKMCWKTDHSCYLYYNNEEEKNFPNPVLFSPLWRYRIFKFATGFSYNYKTRWDDIDEDNVPFHQTKISRSTREVTTTRPPSNSSQHFLICDYAPMIFSSTSFYSITSWKLQSIFIGQTNETDFDFMPTSSPNIKRLYCYYWR